MKCYFGIDVGGTTIKIGKFNGFNLVDKTEVKTKQGFVLIDEIAFTVNEMKGDDEIVSLGIGVPGPVKNGIVYGCTNLGFKQKVNLKKKFEELFAGVKVEIINDANAACFGEAKFSFKSKYKNVLFVTLGTGIGGGIMIDGKIYEGFNGSSGEIGHIKVESGNKRKCSCGLYDCAECYASATGIAKTAKEIMKEELSSKEVFDLALKNDQNALKVVDYSIEKLCICLAGVSASLNPECIILGGGVSRAGEFLRSKVEETYKKYVFHTMKTTKFLLSKLSNDAGMYGCFYAAKGEVND